MFKDMTLSKELQAQFRENKGTSSIGGVEFGIEVLTTGNWPVDNQPTCTIPPEMRKCASDFEMFYKNKHQNRNLLWLYHNGQAEVQTLFTAKKFQLICNVFQATVLCFYNDTDELTVQQIKEKSNVPDEFLKPALIHLCNPKIRVLDKQIKKPTLDDPNEKIKINPKFTSNNIRVNLIPTQTAKKKTTDDNKGENQLSAEVKTERQVIIQATCVKVLKTRKTVTYMELIPEVMGMIQMFKAQPPMIKEQIEVLI